MYKIKNWRAYVDRVVQRLFVRTGGQLGVLMMRSELTAKVVRADGSEQDLGLLSCRVVTTAGVNYMRDDFNAATGGADIGNFNFHDCGTTNTAEAVTDTTLAAAYGGARVAGTQSSPASKQYRTVGTITFSGTFAIVEHGIFSASSAGTLWDRSVFAAINVVSGDAIQFTYTLTINDGG